MVTYTWPDPPAKRTETQGSMATVFLVTWIATCWIGGTISVGLGWRFGGGRGTAVGVGVTIGVSGGGTIRLLHPVIRITAMHRRRRERNAFIKYNYRPVPNG